MAVKVKRDIRTHLNLGFLLVILFSVTSLGVLFSLYFLRSAKENVTARLNVAIQTAWDQLNFQHAKTESLLMQTIQYNPLDELVKRRESGELDELLERISASYGGLGYFMVTDENGMILSSLNHPAGQPWHLAYLLGYLEEERKPISTLELLPEENIHSSLQAFREKVQVVSLNGAEISHENSAMINIVAAPIFDDRQQLVGSLVGGTLLNNDHELTEAYTEKVPETYLSIAIDGLRVCSNISVDDFRYLEGSVQEQSLIQTTQAGRRYSGEIYVQGRPALIVVDPVFNYRGDPIGNMGVGAPVFVIPELSSTNLTLIALFSLMILLVAMVVVSFMTKVITTPIYRLQNLARAVATNEVNVKEITWQERYVPLELQELAESILQMAKNLTQEKLLLEEKVNERTKQLAATINELESSNQYKSQFLGNISHELRTPLNSIISFAVLLQDKIFGELNSRQEEYVGIIINSGNHLLEMINDILDLIRLGNRGERVNPVPVDLDELVQDAATLLSPQMLAKDLSFEIDLSEDLPEPVWDAKKIQQIITNLLSNAIKFSRQGGSIQVVARRTAGYNKMIDLLVKDTGIGIAPEMKEKVFLAFEQADDTYTQVYKGVGLGLAICKALVELHGGWIWLEDNPEGGTCACVRLPANPFGTNYLKDQ